MSKKQRSLHEGLDMFMPGKYTEAYPKLATERVIFLSEDITKETSSTLAAWLLYYDHENEEDIKIYINSNGGDVFALNHMYDIIQMIKSPISTICLGKAYSAGACMLAAGAKGKRYIMPHANVMIHGVQCRYPSSEGCDQQDSRIELSFLEKANMMVLGMLAKHTGHSLEKIVKDCSRDFYLNAEQALEYGLVDVILYPK